MKRGSCSSCSSCWLAVPLMLLAVSCLVPVAARITNSREQHSAIAPPTAAAGPQDNKMDSSTAAATNRTAAELLTLIIMKTPATSFAGAPPARTSASPRSPSIANIPNIPDSPSHAQGSGSSVTQIVMNSKINNTRKCCTQPPRQQPATTSLPVAAATAVNNSTPATAAAATTSTWHKRQNSQSLAWWRQRFQLAARPRPRRPRQAPSPDDQHDKCQAFVVGRPEKNELYSPDFPHVYPKNMNCTRVITAPKGQIIRLDFRNYFHIEAKEECKFDFLEIRDGQFGYSNLIGRYCGTDFPPEITSKERYLWLHFHSDESIEYAGFTAVFEFTDRNREAPSTDLNCTIEKEGFEGFINSTDVPADIKKTVISNRIPLDCIWRIRVQDKWRIQTKFIEFKLSKPNDCEANFLDIFPEQTVMPLRVKNFCGSAGESLTSESNILHLRFYAEQIAINSSFSILFTAFRDRGLECTLDEYDCEDATCIAKDLKCNGRDNCKFRWDEEGCSNETEGQSEHVTIIIIVLALILSGMVLTFLVNCIRKIKRDQKIIREHLQKSRESKLNEFERCRSSEDNTLVQRRKQAEISLPVLNTPSSYYYQEVHPVAEEVEPDELKEEQEMFGSFCHMTMQTNHNEANHAAFPIDEIQVKVGYQYAPLRPCEMGCQTRESLRGPTTNSSLVSNVGDIAARPPPRLSSFESYSPRSIQKQHNDLHQHHQTENACHHCPPWNHAQHQRNRHLEQLRQHCADEEQHLKLKAHLKTGPEPPPRFQYPSEIRIPTLAEMPITAPKSVLSPSMVGEAVGTATCTGGAVHPQLTAANGSKLKVSKPQKAVKSKPLAPMRNSAPDVVIMTSQ